MSPHRGPVYELTEVGLAFGGFHALRQIELSVSPGESVALVGPSGAGKTSLLRVLAGRVAPSAGVLRINGCDPAVLRRRRELPHVVGLMPQQFDLIPQLTVKHNIEAGALGRWGLARSLAALLLPVEDPAARRAAARVGIEHLFNQRTSRCSGGEQQRTALARLLVQSPQVLLVDEPVSSLDPARSDDLLALLRQLADQDGRTLVASLHNPDLARRHFDRVVGLRDGRVVFDVPAADLSNRMTAQVYELDTDQPAHVADR